LYKSTTNTRAAGFHRPSAPFVQQSTAFGGGVARQSEAVPVAIFWACEWPPLFYDSLK